MQKKSFSSGIADFPPQKAKKNAALRFPKESLLENETAAARKIKQCKTKNTLSV